MATRIDNHRNFSETKLFFCILSAVEHPTSFPLLHFCAVSFFGILQCSETNFGNGCGTPATELDTMTVSSHVDH